MNRRHLLSLLAVAPFVTTGTVALAQDNPAKLRVALLPDENAATIIQNAQPLKNYLEFNLHKDIELVVTTDYSSMIEAMRFGRIEIAYFGPRSYVLAKSKAPNIEPFAVGVTNGSPTYRSVIITQADGAVKAIEDIKGKTVGFGDPASTSSHLIPRAFLAKRNLIGDKDYKFVHLGAHDAVGATNPSWTGSTPAQRYSIATFRPSTYPVSLRPWRNAATKGAHGSGDALLRNPTTGIAGCCARAPRAATRLPRRRPG
jgi:phosphonate transport system substrate-binding protein